MSNWIVSGSPASILAWAVVLVVAVEFILVFESKVGLTYEGVGQGHTLWFLDDTNPF